MASALLHQHQVVVVPAADRDSLRGDVQLVAGERSLVEEHHLEENTYTSLSLSVYIYIYTYRCIYVSNVIHMHIYIYIYK